MNREERLKSLEERHGIAGKQGVGVVITGREIRAGRGQRVAEGKTPGGALMEFVDVEDGAEDLYPEELDRFVGRFPIETTFSVSPGKTR